MSQSQPSSQGFSQSELNRYSRHLILPEVGPKGQMRLKSSSVLIVGAGGLGSPAALYLAAAGVGRIGLADHDNVDLSNLQRQILHSTDSVGSSKLDSAARRLDGLNPEVEVTLHRDMVVAANALEILQNYDLVLDGTDNFATRYLINDACVMLKKPNVHGSIYRFEGQASVFCAEGGPCYRCLFPDPPPADSIPNCAEGGVLGVLAGVIGVIQATEAIKLLLDLGDSLAGRLLLYDALHMRFDMLKIAPDPECPVCGDTPTIRDLKDSVVSCLSSSPAGPICNAFVDGPTEIDAQELQVRLSDGAELVLLDVRTHEEFEFGHLDGAQHIPLQELEVRIAEIDREQEIVVYCKAGGRSRRAIDLLQSQGFQHLLNLTGGILAWQEEIDPSMPCY